MEENESVPVVGPVVELRAAHNDASHGSRVCFVTNEVKTRLDGLETADPACRKIVAVHAARSHSVAHVDTIHTLNHLGPKAAVVVVTPAQAARLQRAARALVARVELQRAVVSREAGSAAAHVVADAAAAVGAAVGADGLVQEVLCRHDAVGGAAVDLGLRGKGAGPLQPVVVIEILMLMLKLEAVVCVGLQLNGFAVVSNGAIEEGDTSAVAVDAAELVPGSRSGNGKRGVDWLVGSGREERRRAKAKMTWMFINDGSF